MTTKQTAILEQARKIKALHGITLSDAINLLIAQQLEELCNQLDEMLEQLYEIERRSSRDY